MLINIKGQVEVKVRPGTKGAAGEAMMHQLANDMDRLLRDFMASRGQDLSLYSFEVKEGNQLMRF